MALAAGTQLGPYEVIALLGAGGMGEVYRARDERLGREVAVTVLPERLAREPDRLRRFEVEARAAGALNHPNVLVSAPRAPPGLVAVPARGHAPTAGGARRHVGHVVSEW